MKLKSIFSLVLFLVVSALTTMNAQNSWTGFDTLVADEVVYFYPNDAANDTLSKNFARGNLYLQILSDSLSGATDVVTEIQYASGVPPFYWVTQASGTLTSNGATAQTLIFEDAVLGARKWRIRSTAGAGTQETEIRYNGDFKPE